MRATLRRGLFGGGGSGSAANFCTAFGFQPGDPACGGGGGGPDPEPPPPPAPDPCPGYIRKFFNIVIPLATNIATKWKTTTNDVLSLSAFESGWLDAHNQALHNP